MKVILNTDGEIKTVKPKQQSIDDLISFIAIALHCLESLNVAIISAIALASSSFDSRIKLYS